MAIEKYFSHDAPYTSGARNASVILWTWLISIVHQVLEVHDRIYAHSDRRSLHFSTPTGFQVTERGLPCNPSTSSLFWNMTWDVSTVLTYLNNYNLKDNSISLRLLTLRTVMLLTLTCLSRSVDLAKLNLKSFRNTPEEGVFQSAALAKEPNKGRAVRDVYFPKFSMNPELCSAQSHLEKTWDLIGASHQLFIATFEPPFQLHHQQLQSGWRCYRGVRYW